MSLLSSKQNGYRWLTAGEGGFVGGPLGGPGGPFVAPAGPFGGPGGPLGAPGGPFEGPGGPLGALGGPVGGPDGPFFTGSLGGLEEAASSVGTGGGLGGPPFGGRSPLPAGVTAGGGGPLAPGGGGSFEADGGVPAAGAAAGVPLAEGKAVFSLGGSGGFASMGASAASFGDGEAAASLDGGAGGPVGLGDLGGPFNPALVATEDGGGFASASNGEDAFSLGPPEAGGGLALSLGGPTEAGAFGSFGGPPRGAFVALGLPATGGPLRGAAHSTERHQRISNMRFLVYLFVYLFFSLAACSFAFCAISPVEVLICACWLSLKGHRERGGPVATTLCVSLGCRCYAFKYRGSNKKSDALCMLCCAARAYLRTACL